ncbi:alpha/beta fold hydrolase [Tropicimonas sp. IMCC34011]|uniref:alpha/beta fold hydrolase n=1 Tax=Tropicimonas sp. IMCC34011 TaxID=2248759 RepID=UPI000E23BD7E|nr:alpha/beta hydrolase [Tropicimonas sp. IMCC34011]
MTDMPYRDVEANGLRMRIADQGTGPMVLLCHGFPESAYAWRHQIDALSAKGYRVVAPDLRGFGGTDAPEPVEAYALQTLVGDMVALLDVLGEESAVIVGNDWGATLAWQAAFLRPDRFTAVAAIGVPMMSQPPVPPTQIFPATDEALFYTLYFQQPGIAEAEFEQDERITLLKIFYAASGVAGPRQAGDATPNPFAMVSRQDGLLTPLPTPNQMPNWLTPSDLNAFVADYAKSGFRGPLNLYRNLDRNWHLQKAFAGRTVDVPALYIVGTRDTGLTIPGMRDIIAGQSDLVPQLREPVFLDGVGHWAPQEQPDEVNNALLTFLADVAH